MSGASMHLDRGVLAPVNNHRPSVVVNLIAEFVVRDKSMERKQTDYKVIFRLQPCLVPSMRFEGRMLGIHYLLSNVLKNEYVNGVSIGRRSRAD